MGLLAWEEVLFPLMAAAWPRAACSCCAEAEAETGPGIFVDAAGERKDEECVAGLRGRGIFDTSVPAPLVFGGLTAQQQGEDEWAREVHAQATWLDFLLGKRCCAVAPIPYSVRSTFPQSEVARVPEVPLRCCLP